MIENLTIYKAFLESLEAEKYSVSAAKRPALYQNYLEKKLAEAFDEIVVKGNSYSIDQVMTATQYDLYGLGVALDVLDEIKRQNPNLF